jgi:dihydroneopterin aldolase
MKARSLDRIWIRNLKARGVVDAIGGAQVEPEELAITLALSVDLRQACRSDQLEDSIDYSSLKKRIMALIERGGLGTIGAVAERVAAECLDDVRVKAVQVYVERMLTTEPARSVSATVKMDRLKLRKRERQ